MSADNFFNALLKRYNRIYDPEANDRAILEKEELARRRADLAKLWASKSRGH
jgi:hypothetical protein